MAIKLAKKHKRAATETSVTPDSNLKYLSALVDARGSVLAEEKELKAKLAKIALQKKEMEKDVREYVQTLSLDPDETYTVSGMMYSAVVGKMGNSRVFAENGKRRVLELLTTEEALSILTFKLGDLDQYLTGVQREEVLDNQPTTRSVQVKIKV